MAILGLKLLLKQTADQMDRLNPEGDEYGNLTNDEKLIESIIGWYKDEYRTRFGPKDI